MVSVTHRTSEAHSRRVHKVTNSSALNSQSASNESSPLIASKGKPIGDFLTPSGQFDFDAAKRSGYQGTLDLKGFQSHLDPGSGQPVFRQSSAASQTGFSDPNDVDFDNNMSSTFNGVMGEVYATTIYHGRLIVGGKFWVAGAAVKANNIAAWDGSNWSTLGVGVDRKVEALTVYRDQLIVAGSFSSAGGVERKGIAAWDGSTWSGLGLDSLAQWDRYRVSFNALGVYDSQLIVAQCATDTGRILAWDGSNWSILGSAFEASGHFEEINALGVYANQLIVAGRFTEVDDVLVNNIAAWDGSKWSALKGGVSGHDYTSIHNVTVYDNRLIVSGSPDRDNFGGAKWHFISAWDGSNWSAFIGVGMNVEAMTIFDNKLVVGGDLGAVYGTDSLIRCNIAAWDGVAWSSLGKVRKQSSYDYPFVQTLTVYHNSLIAGGWFDFAPDGSPAAGIASWNRTNWSSLGEGRGLNHWIFALTIYNKRLIAGGRFFAADGEPANNIAAWDGSSWSSLGLGVHGYISAFATYNGKLIVAGYFDTAGNEPANNIAAWDGASWSSLGPGPGILSAYYHLAVYDNQLMVTNKIVGENMYAIATWDGVEWSSIALPDSGMIIQMVNYDGALLVEHRGTGWHNTVIDSWNGSSWARHSTLTLGGIIFASDNRLIAYQPACDGGGCAPWVIGGRIMSWDGSTWSRIGWLDSYISAFTVYDNQLVVGGGFTMAGEKRAFYIVAWSEDFQTAVESDVDPILPTGFALHQNYPNPFNPTTVISYSLPVKANVTVSIYNILGQTVKTFAQGEQSAGTYSVTWDATDTYGKEVASGMYFYKVTAGEYTASKKMVLLK